MAPTGWFLSLACNGGGWAPVPLDLHVERKAIQGIAGDAAARHWRALALGGCVEAEALAIVRDTATIDAGVPGVKAAVAGLMDLADLPADRWFRDAWRRTESGGPIWIDLPAARLIQLRRAEQAAERHNKAAVEEDDRVSLAGRLTNGPAFVEFDRRRIRDRLVAAATVEQVRAVWPEGLPWLT